MKHAGKDTLDNLAEFLMQLRQWTVLKEKRPGIFYLKSKAFLHFHDDPEGIFADVKLDQQNYSMYRVSTDTERAQLLKRIERFLVARTDSPKPLSQL